MLESRLLVIINRLVAMTKDQEDDLQVRNFEIDGRLVVRVFYNQVSGVFTIVNAISEERFKFEWLDLAAIEIFDMLYAHRFRKS